VLLSFLGEYYHSVDSKGRMIIPSKFRDGFGEVFYLCKGFEDCLMILTSEEIQKIETKIKETHLTNKGIRQFMRIFFSGMVDVSFDPQGRVLIPKSLRAFANIDKEATVVGTGLYLEIWQREKWEEHRTKMDSNRGQFDYVLEALDNEA